MGGEPSHFITITRRLTQPHRKMNERARRIDKGCEAEGTGGEGGNKAIKCVRVVSMRAAIGCVISNDHPMSQRLSISTSQYG